MELDELRDRTKRLHAPHVAPGAAGKSVGTTDDLVARLKAHDEKEGKRLRRIRLFFSIAAALYCAILLLTFVLPPDGPAGGSRLVLTLYTLVFVAIATRSVVAARRIARTDYSAPVGTFLREAERRFRVLDWREIWLFVPLFVVITFAGGLGWMIGAERYLPALERSAALILFAVFWVIVCAVAVVVGRVDWRKNRAPIFEEIRRLRLELFSDQ